MIGSRCARALATVGALTVALLAVVWASVIAEAKRPPALRVAVESTPAGWDPHLDLDPVARIHWEQVYESLVQLGPGLGVEPALAESWEQRDPRTYVFHLRRGVKFHHGREMVADDVKYSLERGKQVRPGAENALVDVTSVDVLDKYDVKVTLAAPDTTFLTALGANRGTAIVPREIVERPGGLKAVMVGTGPYRVKRHLPGKFTEFDRYPDYWARGLPRTDEMTFLVMPEESARLAALRSRGADLGWVSDPRFADEAAGQQGLVVDTPRAVRRIELRLQHGRPPFQSKKLRQALAAAVDREALVKGVL